MEIARAISGSPGQQPQQAARRCASSRVQRRDMDAPRTCDRSTGDMLRVGRVVDEAAEMDAMRARQMRSMCHDADLVALVGRIGDAVRQEQQVAHRAQPSPRTIGGPSRLATGSGRRFQAAMKAGISG